MIETSRRNKDATRPANQWIVETHSESLILRIQKKIKEKELDPQDVSIIYVEATSKGSRILEIPMDEDGDFMVDWPDGFFDERFKEAFGF
jgi:predicted ATPase